MSNGDVKRDSTQRETFLCALDVQDTQPLNRKARLQLKGWVISTRGEEIAEVALRINAGRPIRAQYPQPRPDVMSYYPQFEGAGSSGFATPLIRLEGKDRTLHIEVIVRTRDGSHVVHQQRVQLLWFDPATDLFPLGRVGPFAYPDAIDETRLPTFPDCAPVFVVGSSAQIGQASRALGHSLADGGAFVEMLAAVVACHDAYTEFSRSFIVHFRSQIEAYAVGKLDIHQVLGAIVSMFHDRYVARAPGGRLLYALSGPQQCLAVPMLATIYPRARFTMLRRPVHLRILDPAQAFWLSAADRLRERDDTEDPLEVAWRWRSYGTLLRLIRHRIDASSWVDMRELLELSSATPAAPPPLPLPGGIGVPAFEQPSPIFVLGAGRSGTSAVVGAIRAAGIEGFHEGHVFPLLKGMLANLSEAVEGETRAMVSSVTVKATIDGTFGSHGSRVWLDKTPDHPMIDCVPLIRQVFPGARFIMIYRHPIAFAESRRRKFSEPLLSAVNEWVKCIESWKANRESLPASCYLQFDCQSLNDPAMQETLCDFLQLDSAQRKRFTDYLASERPELTRIRAGALAAFGSLSDERQFNLRSILFRMLDSLGEYMDDMSWTPQQKQEVAKLLGTLPEEFGYAIHRPADHLLDIVVEWARQLEEYRHTAEYHEANAEGWAEECRREVGEYRRKAEHQEKSSAAWAAEAQRQREEAKRVTEEAQRQVEQYRISAEHHEKSSAEWAAEAQRIREEAKREVEQYRLKAEHHEKSSADWAAEAQRQTEEAQRQREKAQYLEEESRRIATAQSTPSGAPGKRP